MTELAADRNSQRLLRSPRFDSPQSTFGVPPLGGAPRARFYGRVNADFQTLGQASITEDENSRSNTSG